MKRITMKQKNKQGGSMAFALKRLCHAFLLLYKFVLVLKCKKTRYIMAFLKENETNDSSFFISKIK